MSIVLIIVCVSVLAFTLYSSDLMHKMKEDMRLIKIRTGKLIHLLDAVLSASGGKGAQLTAEFRTRLKQAQALEDEPDPSGDAGQAADAPPSRPPDASPVGGSVDAIIQSVLSRVRA